MRRIIYSIFFLILLTKNGVGQNMLSWVRTFTNSSIDNSSPASVCLDPQENIVIAGTFYGTIDFDPGPAIYTLTSPTGNGGHEIFVSKVDPQGNFMWAKKIEGENRGVKAAVSRKTGDIYLTGHFYQWLDCDPGPGTHFLSASGTYDGFLIKLNASGQFVFGKRIGGAAVDMGCAIAVDDLDNVYVSGIFNGTVDFDPGPGTAMETSAQNFQNQFICKFDSTSQFLWVKILAGGASVSYAMAIDNNADLLLTGQFENVVDFDPGPTTYTAANFKSLDFFGYVMKLSSTGVFQWANPFSGSSYGTSIKVGSDNSVFVSGTYGGKVNFDPNASNYIDSVPRESAFIGRWNSSGSFTYLKKISGTGSCVGAALSIGPHDHIYATGYFTKKLNYFSGDSVNFSQPLGTGINIFLSELQSSGTIEFVGAVGGDHTDYCSDIATNSHGEYYIAGTYYGKSDFEPTTDSTFVFGQGTYLIKIRPKDITIGLEKFNFSNIISCEVYPNPSSDIFRIVVSNHSAGELVVTDISGSIVTRQKFNGKTPEQELSFKNYSTGIYFLQVRTHDGVIIKKLIKD